MTIEQRLEAIQILTVATAALSNGKFGRYEMAKVIAQLQNALDVIGLEELNIDENAYTLLEKLNK
mgnify:CR=1 FL=1